MNDQARVSARDPDAVVLNLAWLRPGQVGGSEHYAVNLANAMIDRGVRLHLVVGPDVPDAHPDLVSRCTHEVVRSPGGRVGRILGERRRFRRVLASERVVHHLGGTVAARSSTPVALTVFDLQVFDLPQHFHPVKRRYLRAVLPPSLRRADLVCVTSSFVIDGLQRHLGVDPDRCRLVPAPIVVTEPAGESPPWPYLLYPAVTWGHKAHTLLVEMMEAVDPDLHLVLTGAAGPAHRQVVAAIEASGARERIHHLGRVAPGRLAALYRGARAVVVPSQYEGFGQPAIEAMAHGVPVLVSTHGALPEVVGGAARTVPDDPEAWAAAVGEVDDDRPDRIAAGLARAARFSPEAAAIAQLAVYDELG